MQLAWVVFLVCAATSPADSSGSIAGRVVSTSGALPEMVVYLEPMRPDQTVTTSLPTLVVSQKGAKFAPSLLVVSVGQTIEFRNDEDKPIEHNVFSRSPAKAFDLGLYPPNTTGKTVTFDKPGVVRLYCSIHRYMDGLIFVCPTPLFAKVQADGQFTIVNVPAGQWRLKTWQRGARFNEQDQVVNVETGKQAQVNLEMKR